jgi:hypothetical protein
VLVVGVVVGVICGKEEVPRDEQTNKESQKAIDIVKSAISNKQAVASGKEGAHVVVCHWHRDRRIGVEFWSVLRYMIVTAKPAQGGP